MQEVQEVQNSSSNVAVINSVKAEKLNNSASWVQAWRAKGLRMGRAIFLKVALFTLVREITFKSESFQDAIDYAREFGLENNLA